MTTPPTLGPRQQQAASAVGTRAERRASSAQRVDALRLTEAEVELLRREFTASPLWRDMFYIEPSITV